MENSPSPLAELSTTPKEDLEEKNLD